MITGVPNVCSLVQVCHCDQTSLGNSSPHIRESELAGGVQASQSKQGLEKLSLDPSELHSSPG